MKIQIPGPFDPSKLLDWAKEAVLAAKKRPLQGRQRHRYAVRVLAKRIDAALVWPVGPIGLIAEMVDGKAIEFLLGAIVKAAYNLLESEGKVGAKKAEPKRKKPAPPKA